jgi:putative acetyltransferase
MHTIRQYIESDLDDVLATWENANKLAHPFLKEDFVDQVRKDIPALYLPNADTWVIEDDNEKKVVGFIALIGNEVGAIFLQPEHHGKKLGKMMMDIAHQLHGDLELEVFEKNTIGREFYKQYGFTQIDEMEHEASGEHVLRLKYTA